MSTCLFSQGTPPPAQQPEDTIVSRPRPKRPDSLKEKFYFRSVRFGTDILALVRTGTSKSFSGWEVNADADFGKFYAVVDVGQWTNAYNLDSGKYGSYKNNNGTYFRIGADINLLKKDPDRNMFFFGFRYGHAFYNETGYLIFPVDPNFGNINQSVHNTGVSANWAELTTGLRVKVWKEFWMGYTARMKFAVGTNGDNQFKSFDVPGYGLNEGGITWGFNYQVFWRFAVNTKKKTNAK